MSLERVGFPTLTMLDSNGRLSPVRDLGTIAGIDYEKVGLPTHTSYLFRAFQGRITAVAPFSSILFTTSEGMQEIVRLGRLSQGYMYSDSREEAHYVMYPQLCRIGFQESTELVCEALFVTKILEPIRSFVLERAFLF